MESAIRAAPQSRFARSAYKLLEDTFLDAYTGSSGEHVPAHSRERLRSAEGSHRAARERLTAWRL
ncbi:MAG: hypothetical protein HOI95_21465 [Chromatiales bacterium]|nr:hypothetical protein [Chromatiales bacterium]